MKNHSPSPISKKRNKKSAFYCSGFTLIELLVVMAIIATLLSITMPHYFGSIERAKEAALRQNLANMRDALDKYYGDHGKYPESLDELVTDHYLRTIPADPVTGNKNSWVIVAPESSHKGNVYNVQSSAEGIAKDGSAYKEW